MYTLRAVCAVCDSTCEGDSNTHLCKYAGYNRILLGGSTHIVYSSALPVKIEHEFTRVIFKHPVKRGKRVPGTWYLILQKLLIGILSTSGTAVQQ